MIKNQTGTSIYILGVTPIADIRGPYTPLSGIAFVPLPDHSKWISRVLPSTRAVKFIIIALPVPLAASTMLKSLSTFFPCGNKKIIFK